MEGMDTITPRPRPMWLAGRPEDGDDTRPVTHPHDATEIATVAVADTATTDRAVTEVARFAGGMRSWPVADRAAALDTVAEALAGRGDELAEIVTAESGKPLRHAETEVAHAVAALRAGARSAGETRNLDGRTDDGGLTLTRRVPRGPAVAAVPPHRPLGHAAHAVAAAFAVGTPVLLAPSVRAPLSALGLGEVLTEADLPTAAFSVLPVDDDTADVLAADPRLTRLPAPPADGVTTVVLADWPDPDAAAHTATTTVGAAGPFGPAAHEITAQRAVADELLPALIRAVSALPAGDAYDTAVAVAPMPDDAAAHAAVEWVDSAVAAGAELLTGGGRRGRLVEPTLLNLSGVRHADAPAVLPPPPAGAPVVTVTVTGSADAAMAAAVTAGARCCDVLTHDARWSARALADFDVDEIVVRTGGTARPETVRSAMRLLTAERTLVLPDPETPPADPMAP